MRVSKFIFLIFLWDFQHRHIPTTTRTKDIHLPACSDNVPVAGPNVDTIN